MKQKTPTQLPDASDCYETAARITIREIIELFLLAMIPEIGKKDLPTL